MSQFGSLVFYTLDEMVNPRQLLTRLLKQCGVTRVLVAARTIGEQRSWADFCAERDGVEVSPAEEDIVSEGVVGAEALAQLYVEGTHLTFDVDGQSASPYAVRIADAVEAMIPEDIRGGFIPGSLFIDIGYHDLFECAEHEDGLFIARPFLSISFFGYDTPNDWPAAREAILALPEVQQVKAALEQVCGKLDECIFWEV